MGEWAANRRREAFLMWQLAATRVIALAEATLERGGLDAQLREAVEAERDALREYRNARADEMQEQHDQVIP